MTVNTTTSSTTQIGNGATTVWNYSFYIPDALNVVVKITRLSTGNVTTLSSSQYTITGLGDAAGGTVTYSPALGTDYSITIARLLPVVQETSLSNQGALYPVVIEDALDYLTMICQQMTATYNRAVTAPDNDVVTSLVLPVKALRAEKLMGFDVNGSPTYYPVGASTSASIINFTQAGTGAVTRSVQSKMQDVLSVKDFGATGDGTTDDTTAVQACITAAALANRAVYIPGGAYKLSAQLVYSGRTVSIYGDGPEITELFWTAAAGSTGILVTLAKIGSFSVNFNIRGLSLTTLKTVSGTAIRVVGTTTYDDRVSTRAIIKDLVIRGRTNPTTDGWLIGVDLDATPRCYVENVNFIGKVNGSEPNYSSTYGIRYGNFSSATIQPAEVMMHACLVSYAQNAIYCSDMEGALLTSCQIVGVNNGVTFTAAVARPHGSIIGCHINASAAAVLVAAMYEVVLSSNLFYLQNSTADGVGIDVSAAAGYFTINNNVFENYNNAWACNSIVISNGTKGTIASNIFRRTNSIDTTRNGVAIWLTAGSSYCTISNDNTFGVVATTVLDSGSNNVNLFTSVGSLSYIQSGTGAVPRLISAKFGESVSVLDFGATGNGSTNDTTAFNNALATGKTVLVPYSATAYVLDGVSVPSNSRLYALGKVTLKRKNSASAAGVLICSGVNNVIIDGFLIDGNLSNNTVGADNIRVVGGCYNIRIQNNESLYAKYNVGYGNGVAFYDNADAANETTSYVTGNRVTLNGGVGILVERCYSIKICENYGASNTYSGVKLQDPTIPVPSSPITQHILISDNHFTTSAIGICIYGDRSGVSALGDIITQTNYIHQHITVSNNVCWSNSNYGIFLQGTGIAATGNVCRLNGNSTANGGMLFVCDRSSLTGNTVVDNYFYGIDCGFSSYSDVTGNTVYGNGKTIGQGIGINIGASNGTSVSENRIGDNGGGTAGSYQILASGVDGANATSYGTFIGYDLTINNNTISIGNASAVGIKVVNGFNGVSICNNTIYNRLNGSVFQVYLPGASTVMSNNRVLNSSGLWEVSTASAGTTVIPDYGEVVRITGTSTVNYIYTTAFNYGRDKVCTVVMSNIGSGYTSVPTVSLVGGGGTNATGAPALGADGKIYGVYITNYGSGYTPNASFAVGFSGGGGSAAAGTAYVGCDNAVDRVVTLRFDGAAVIKNATGNIFLSGGDFTGSATKTLTLRSLNGTWVEVSRA
jgi:parallel beta-helix repeat protein